ncbi:MAG: PLD nuclease N-terminal domain-containing protein [Acidimicrobiia bacterium]
MLFEAEGVIAFIVFAFWIWAIVDCITTDSELHRNLPKGVWLVIVILLFDLGAILWLLLGRPMHKHWRPATGVERAGPSRRAVGPEDQPRFESSITDRRSEELDRRLASWEAEQAGFRAELGAPDAELDAKAAELVAREADLRRRELELRQREVDRREADLDGS